MTGVSKASFHCLICYISSFSSRAVSFTAEHTHTRLTALCPGLPGWAGTRKVKPIWILLKQETVSGNGISWAICKSAPRSRQIAMLTPSPLSFLQAGCPSCHPTNSVKALKALFHCWTGCDICLDESCFQLPYVRAAMAVDSGLYYTDDSRVMCATSKYDEPEVENVARGRSNIAPSSANTFSIW